VKSVMRAILTAVLLDDFIQEVIQVDKIIQQNS
jgi:hypothetical protein